MKVGAKKKGGGEREIIHLALDATCLFLVDVGSATGYLTHHSIQVTALYRRKTDCSGWLGGKGGKDKKDWTYKMSVLDRVQMIFGFVFLGDSHLPLCSSDNPL